MKTQNRYFRYFKVNGEDREFMYLFGSIDRTQLQPFIDLVKKQGDFYRITQYRNHFIIWDARY